MTVVPASHEPLPEVSWREALLPAVLAPMARRFAMATLISLAMVVVFAAVGARALSAADAGATTGHEDALLWGGVGVAVFTVLACRLLKRRGGVWAGWAALVVTAAYGLFFWWVLLIVVLFVGIWIAGLHYGARLHALAARRAERS